MKTKKDDRKTMIVDTAAANQTKITALDVFMMAK